MDVTEKEKARA